MHQYNKRVPMKELIPNGEHFNRLIQCILIGQLIASVIVGGASAIIYCLID